MPIIPRFASVQDPNTPPNVDFSQGIMQSALAGAQLRRMGVEEKQADARLGMQQESFGLRKEAYQRGVDLDEDMAKIAEAKAMIPQNATPQDRQMFVTQGIMPKLKTAKGRELLMQDFAADQKERVVAEATDKAIGGLADSIRRSSMMPGGEPFAERYQAIGDALQGLGQQNIAPEMRAEMLDGLMRDYQGLQKAHQDAHKQQVEENDAIGTIQSMLEMSPPGSPSRQKLTMLQGRFLSGELTAKQTLRASTAIQMGEVEIRTPGGKSLWMDPEGAAEFELEMAQTMLQMHRAEMATRAAEERARQADERLAQGAQRIERDKEALGLRRDAAKAKAEAPPFGPSEVNARMTILQRINPKATADELEAEAVRQLSEQFGMKPAAPSVDPEEESLSPAAQAELARRRAELGIK
jgi:hypothetical protein